MSKGKTRHGSKGQWRRARTAAALGMLLVGGSALTATATWAAGYDDGSASAPSAPAAGPAIDLDVVNANLLSVVRALKFQSSAQVVVVGGDYQPVTLTVTAPLDDVLRYIAQSAGATVSRDSNGVYTFRPAGDAGSSDDGSAQPQPAAAPAEPPTPQEERHWEKIVLQNVDPNFILNMLNDPAGYRDSSPWHNPIVNTDNSQVAPVAAAPPVISEENMNVQVGSNQQPSVPIPNGQVGTSSATQANRFMTSSEQQAQQFPQQQGGFNPFNPAQNATTNFPQGAGGQQPQGANLRPDGIDSIIANEQDNALIVRGTAEGIAELKQIINFLDRAPKQVQIKVEFITASVADVDQFGISFDLLPFPNIETGFNGGGTPTGSAGGSFLTYAQGNLVAQMQALLSTSKGKVIAAPLITTTNNTPATIDFSSQIPYQTTTTVAQGSGNAVSSTSTNFITIENNLTVTPRINGDNSVSLLLRPELSTPGTPSFTGGPPPVSRQLVSTYRTVANGETMVIGGLVQKDETNAQDRYPFLSELPIIGSLFRTRNLNYSSSELLIFVTPTVLPPIGSNSDYTNAAGGPPADTEGVGIGFGGAGGGGVGVTP